MDFSFDAGIMLLLQDKALIIKFFYKNGESVRDALRKFCTAKRQKKKKENYTIGDTETCQALRRNRKIVHEVVDHP